MDAWAQGEGSVTLTAEDQVFLPRATYGDAARLRLEFQQGITRYRVELDRAGFPPDVARAVRRPPYLLGGGVRVDTDVFGATGVGPRFTRAHAAVAVFGVGRVYRDGELLTDRAVVEVMGLTTAIHSPDATFLALREARPGMTELLVTVVGLPAEAEPTGFLAFGFHGVALRVDGRALPNEEVPNGTDLSPAVAQGPMVSPREARNALPEGGAVRAANPEPIQAVTPPATGLASVETGIPASPPVANNGGEPAPLQGTPPVTATESGTALLSTPAPAGALPETAAPTPLGSGITPLNAAPAAPLPATPVPANAAAATPLLPATPLPATPQPLNALPAAPLPNATPPNPVAR